MPHDEGLPNFCLEIFLKGLEKSRKAGIREKKKKLKLQKAGGTRRVRSLPPHPTLQPVMP